MCVGVEQVTLQKVVSLVLGRGTKSGIVRPLIAQARFGPQRHIVSVTPRDVLQTIPGVSCASGVSEVTPVFVEAQVAILGSLAALRRLRVSVQG